MQKGKDEIKPFTKEEMERFDEYCYTVFGLHFVGDTMKKHTVIDGDELVNQVRQANATIQQMQPAYEAAMILAKFTESNGVVLDGYRTRELLRTIVVESKDYWNNVKP